MNRTHLAMASVALVVVLVISSVNWIPASASVHGSHSRDQTTPTCGYVRQATDRATGQRILVFQPDGTGLTVEWVMPPVPPGGYYKVLGLKLAPLPRPVQTQEYGQVDQYTLGNAGFQQLSGPDACKPPSSVCGQYRVDSPWNLFFVMEPNGTYPIVMGNANSPTLEDGAYYRVLQPDIITSEPVNTSYGTVREAIRGAADVQKTGGCSGPRPPDKPGSAPISPPTIPSFSTDSASITEGQCTTLRWTTSNAQSVTLDGRPVARQDSSQVCPGATSTYVLRAFGTGGAADRSVTVVVNKLPLVDNAQFIADITVPTGAVFDPGHSFVKTWRVKNTGNTTWTTGYQLAFVTGDRLGATSSVSVPNIVSPGGTVDISVNMTAPPSAGSYAGSWSLQNARGAPFGETLWVKITVPAPSQGNKTRPTIDYFALGDSIASGHGLGDDKKTCRRSDKSYPYKLAEMLAEEYVVYFPVEHFLACSGAFAQEPKNSALLKGDERYKWLHNQVAEIEPLIRDDRPTLVSISIGANDFQWLDWRNLLIGFAEPSGYYMSWANRVAEGVAEQVQVDVDTLISGHPNVLVVVNVLYNPFNRESRFFGGPAASYCKDPLQTMSCSDKAQYAIDQLNTALAAWVPVASFAQVRLAARITTDFLTHEAPDPGCGTAPVSEWWIQFPQDQHSNSDPPVPNWLLALTGDKQWHGDCFHPNEAGAKAIAAAVKAAIPPSFAPVNSQAPNAVINSASLNLRSGPGTAYGMLGSYARGAALEVLGKNAAGDWLQVKTPDGKVEWTATSSLQLNIGLSNVKVIQSVPPPPPPPVSKPTLDWVRVPAGSFVMGSSDSDLQQTLAECQQTEGQRTGVVCQGSWFQEPQQTVWLGDFDILRSEVTNAQYNLCVAAGVCQKAGRAIGDTNIRYDTGYFADDFPVMAVSWADSETFCRWAGGRLPTEAEWEKAARGTDGRRYPWGNTFDASRANLGSTFPTRVASFPSGASPYGLMDMSGNVFEWTASQVGSKYVVRGGGWTKDYFRGRAADRGTQLEASFENYDVGFRCAR